MTNDIEYIDRTAGKGMSTVSLCFFWECEGINDSMNNFNLNDSCNDGDLTASLAESAVA